MSGAGEFAGTLRTPLALLRRMPGADTLGAADGDWAEIATVRAAVSPIARVAVGAADGLAQLARWQVIARPGLLAAGDRLAGAGLDLIVLHVTRDPATPDRIVADTEERR